MRLLYPARGAVLCICAAALFAAPAWARPVRHHHHAAARATRAVVARIPLPLARPATGQELALLAVPISRPLREEEASAAPDDADATGDDADSTADRDPTDAAQAQANDAGEPTIVQTGYKLYCARYARERSGIDIQGDARTWWDRAAGFYERAARPESGAVMVFTPTRRMKLGHVAVITAVVSGREVRVDHANWMNDGNIYLNMPVEDVSEAGDWSRVRVWNERDHQWGARIYPIRGFITAKPFAAS